MHMTNVWRQVMQSWLNVLNTNLKILIAAGIWFQLWQGHVMNQHKHWQDSLTEVVIGVLHRLIQK